MSNEPRQLDPALATDAIEIIDQMLQPNARLNRHDWGVAEVCIRTIRKELTNKPTQT